MAEKHEIVIDLDILAADPEALGKLYECASLMIQSSNQKEAELGYKMLEVVDEVMNQAKLKDSPASSE